MTQNAATLQLGQLADALARASGQGVVTAAAELLDEAALAVANHERSFAPRRTGTLAASVVVSHPAPLTAVVGPTVPYAGYVEYGTRPHVIRPRTPGGVLVFTVNGRKVVARSVRHPGTRPQPFARDAATAAADMLAQQLGGRAADLITESR